MERTVIKQNPTPVSLKLRTLAQAKGIFRSSYRFSLRQENPARLTSSRLGESSSPERGHPSPKGEVPRLGYNCSDVPQTLTRSRLGKPLSPERDSTSLKTRALRLSDSSSVSLGLFLQVSHKLGRFAWAKTSDLATVLPATTIYTYPNNITKHLMHPQWHTSLRTMEQ